jgi:hypothetical protein
MVMDPPKESKWRRLGDPLEEEAHVGGHVE